MRTLFAALSLATLAACNSATGPSTESVKNDLSAVKPVCPPGQRPYAAGPPWAIFWVCGPA